MDCFVGGTQWCRFILSIGRDNLQFYPNFDLFSTLKWMKLDRYFFHVSKSSEGKKRRKSSEDQKSPKIIQRSDADHSQIIGGDISLLSPLPGFGIPAGKYHFIFSNDLLFIFFRSTPN